MKEKVIAVIIIFKYCINEEITENRITNIAFIFKFLDEIFKEFL